MHIARAASLVSISAFIFFFYSGCASHEYYFVYTCSLTSLLHLLVARSLFIGKHSLWMADTSLSGMDGRHKFVWHGWETQVCLAWMGDTSLSGMFLGLILGLPPTVIFHSLIVASL